MKRWEGAEAYLLSVARGRIGIVPSLLRGVLNGLAWVYCAGLEVYLLPYHLGIRKRTRLPCPVICVGNLTTGGTGKTPMTQTLCHLLQAQGKKVVILSRGYGGQHEYGCAIVSDGQRVLLKSQESGDEAYLLAKTLPGVPVVVGKDRRVTGSLAYTEFQPDVIVLDDGMQFWQLHRDLDIVLLNACEPFDNGWTFPRGLLREPPSHLKRAGIVVLTNAQKAGSQQVEALRARVQQLAPGRPTFTANLTPTGLQSLVGNTETPLTWLEGRRVTALSAIGNPSAFESMIGEQGGILAGRFRFRDHQSITLAELERLIAESCDVRAEAILTTAKDAVKMPPLNSKLPILTLQVTMQIDSANAFLTTTLEKTFH